MDWTILILPGFCVFFIYIMGKEFDIWDKWFPIITEKLGVLLGRFNMEGIHNIRFDGIGKYFRRR